MHGSFKNMIEYIQTYDKSKNVQMICTCRNNDLEEVPKERATQRGEEPEREIEKNRTRYRWRKRKMNGRYSTARVRCMVQCYT